jgi:putative FmdB family regulatory protein
MPVYEYQCKECGHLEEAFQKISEPPLETCPQCRGGLKKLISQSSFHLKGSGWYVTDYGGNKSDANATGGNTSGVTGGNTSGATSGSDSGDTSTSQSKNSASSDS